jgi:putative ABC transport system substrate-binding protein
MSLARSRRWPRQSLGRRACALLAIALVPSFSYAERVWRVGWLGMDSGMQEIRYVAFMQGMRELGYVEGRDFVVEKRWAEGRFEKLPILARELVDRKVDVIVTAAPPAVRAAMAATSTIPIVMTVHDPVGMLMAESLSRPGKNVTGIAFQDAELTSKRVDYLREAVPKLSRIAIVWNMTGTDQSQMEALAQVAQAANLRTLSLEVNKPADFAEAIAAAKAWGAQGVVQLSAPFITLNRKALIAELRRNRMPATCEMRLYVDDGCLMTYSADLNSLFRRMAHYVDQIFRGTKAGELPIEQPRDFELVINLTTARELGLNLSQDLRYMAHAVVTDPPAVIAKPPAVR